MNENIVGEHAPIYLISVALIADITRKRCGNTTAGLVPRRQGEKPPRYSAQDVAKLRQIKPCQDGVSLEVSSGSCNSSRGGDSGGAGRRAAAAGPPTEHGGSRAAAPRGTGRHPGVRRGRHRWRHHLRRRPPHHAVHRPLPLPDPDPAGAGDRHHQAVTTKNGAPPAPDKGTTRQRRSRASQL